MKTVLTISDLTRMSGDKICIARYTEQGTCIRPQFNQRNLTEDWLWQNGRVIIRPFWRVELDLISPKPEPPHTEDWIIDPLHRVASGALPLDSRSVFLSRTVHADVESMFGAFVEHRERNEVRAGCWIKSGNGERSLGTICPRNIWKIVHELNMRGKWDYRMTFFDFSGTAYDLPVVDLAFRFYLDQLRGGSGMSPHLAAHELTARLRNREVYLRIGLARHWDVHPDRCYLQITGVHTFPDYLDGQCFADF
jgi:hypothetical protein